MRASRDRGFSLIETVIAVSLLAVGVSAVAQLSVAAGGASAAAVHADVIQSAAREKIEQLRALAWTSEPDGTPVSDWSTDVTVTPPAATGGLGLSLSPRDTMLSNVQGFCDFLDANGRWLAGGTRPPAGAAWVRRWSIAPLEGLPDTLLLQVVVIPARVIGDRATVAAARGTNGAWLIEVRTRRAR